MGSVIVDIIDIINDEQMLYLDGKYTPASLSRGINHKERGMLWIIKPN